MLVLDLETMESTTHQVISMPDCLACGAQQAEDRLQLHSRKVYRYHDYRICAPEETYQQYKHLISPITGVVRSLVSVPTASLVHNFTAGHAIRKEHVTIESLRLATRDQSGGKGKSLSKARVSGLCEALERYSAVYINDTPDRIASLNDLGNDAIHPNDLMLFSDAQYENRESWNQGQSGRFQHVPEPFDVDAIMGWRRIQSLRNGTYKFVPMAYCYYGYDEAGKTFCRADSNGLAAGNCIEEAILQGLFELIERDAVAQWWYSRLRMPAVDLSSFEDDYIDHLIDYYQELGRDIWVLDVTTDTGVPTFVAVSGNTKHSPEEILMGFGTHVDARLAITRALLEINQSLPAILKSPQERAAQMLPDFADVIHWWDEATISDHPHLKPEPGLGNFQAADFPRITQFDIKKEILNIVERLHELGMDTFVLNMTRKDVALPVVRVFVPGLRHFWRRLKPGRLYDTPVKMGALQDPLEEGALNPISMFL